MRGITTVEGATAGPAAPRRAAGALAAPLATAVAVVTVVGSTLVLARYDPALVGERSTTPWLSFVELAAAVVMVAGAWLVRATHPAASTGLAVATAGSLLPLWATSPWLPGPVRAGVLAAAPFTVAGVAQVALGWPTEPSPAARRAGRAVYVLAGVAALAHLLGYNPFADPGCFRTCDDVPPLLGGILTTRAAVTVASLLTIAAAALGAAAVVLAARPARAPRSVTGAVVVALAALAVSAATRLVGWGDALASVSRFAPEPFAVAVVGAVVWGVGFRTVRTRAAIDRLAAQLSDPAAALGQSGGAIRGVQFLVPDDGRWVDAAGHDVGDLPAPGSDLVLSDALGPVLRLLLARRADQGEVLAGLTPATRLALRNAHLAAVASARLAQVRASQRRVVATSDAERRRIERDLHDGAQQRLLAISYDLRLARAQAVADSDSQSESLLTQATDQAQAALGELRELAHGIYPAILTEAGLAPALASLADAAPLPVEIRDAAQGRYPAAVETAAYLLVADSLDDAAGRGASHATVSAMQDGARLVVTVEDDGTDRTSAMVQLADRVGALDGRLAVEPTRLQGELPCG